jgi:DNA-binding transcriptional LysR family regulator
MYTIAMIRYALSVARLGSFSAAARECGVKQPTVSAAVGELETAIGIPLFRRTTRSLELTPAGTALMPNMDAILSAVQTLDQSAALMKTPSKLQLRLGFTPLMGAARLGLLLEPFRSENPNVHLIFYESSIADLEDRISAGRLDLIFGAGFSMQRLHKRIKLFVDPLSYCLLNHNVPPRSIITLKDIAKNRLLFTEDLCGLASATKKLLENDRLKVDEYPGRALSYGALEDWVDLQLGGAIVPYAHLRNKARSIPTVDSNGQSIGIMQEAVWRKDVLISNHAVSFVSYMHRVAPKLARGMGWQT